MNITVTDTALLTPTGGIASNTPIKIVCLEGYDQVLTGAISEFTTDDNGAYSFPLYYGVHAIYVRFDTKFKLLGKVTITSELADTATISDLLLYTEPMLPDEIALVSGLVEEARGYAEDAEAAAVQAGERLASYEVETTEYLINTFDSSALVSGDIVKTLGYYSKGTGAGSWRKTGVSISPSQSPSDTGNATISDALGNEYEIVYLCATTEKEINPLSLGAIGDGVNDDTQPIQSAIDSFEVSAGGCVVGTTGKYMITSPLVLRNHISMISNGSASHSSGGAMLIAGADMESMITHDLSQDDGATGTLFSAKVTGWNINANKDSYSVDYVMQMRMVNCRITDNRIQSSTGIGIWFRDFGTGGSNWINWVNNNSISGHDVGGILCQMTDSQIVGNYMSGNGSKELGTGYGIMLASAGGVRVAFNQIELSGEGVAIRRSDASESPAGMIISNYIDFCFHGITLDKLNDTQAGGLAARYSIIGNRISRTGTDNTTGDPSYDIYFKRNVFSTIITGNTLSSANANVPANICLTTGCDDINISNNLFENDVPIINIPTAFGDQFIMGGNIATGSGGKFVNGGSSNGISGTVTITHGLFKAPAWIEIQFIGTGGGATYSIDNLGETTFDLTVSSTSNIRWSAYATYQY